MTEARPNPADPPQSHPPIAPAVVRSTRVWAAGRLQPASVHIDGSRIGRIGAWEEFPGDPAAGYDAANLLVFPGLVDTHVHVNEPGRTHWEGFTTATQAAAQGGVTTICDMPLNSIPATTSVESLEQKRAALQQRALVNVECIGGVVPGNAGQLRALGQAGVCAFKCFLAPSGVPEFPAMEEQDLREALPILADLEVPLMVHAEDPSHLHPGGASRRYADYLASRPVAAERSAIALLVRLLDWCPTPIHIVHLSSAQCLDLVGEARARGRPLTVETCPHYLTFAAEEIGDGATEFKCAPPIRSADEREALWKALEAGSIDLLASDHSPCPPELKDTGGDFFAAWGGIASLELTLSAVWTGARSRGIAVHRIAEWMSANPARLVRLDRRKGTLAQGWEADLTVWDPDATYRVDAQRLHQRHKSTPYAGRTLFGKVMATYAGGRLVSRAV